MIVFRNDSVSEGKSILLCVENVVITKTMKFSKPSEVAAVIYLFVSNNLFLFSPYISRKKPYVNLSFRIIKKKNICGDKKNF